MSQSIDVKVSQLLRPKQNNQDSQQKVKDVIRIVHEKQRHYKKMLSQLNSSPHKQRLNYLFNGSNSISAVTPEQKQIIKDEQLARGSSPEFEFQMGWHPTDKKIRLKFETISHQRSSRSRHNLPKIRQLRELKRYRTEQDQQQTPALKGSILLSPINQLPSIQKKEKSTSQLRIKLAQMKRFGKSTQKLQGVYQVLLSFNPLFTKIQKAIGICLLRAGEIIELKKREVIYQIGSNNNDFFIILEGEVKLKGFEGMRKLCVTGQTLLQQSLFQKNFNGSLQKASSAGESVILKIGMQDYNKLQQQFFKFGFKQGAKYLESLFKRNYIGKNWLRNKYKHIYNN